MKLTVAFISIAWIAALAFPVAYARAPWRSTAPGRSLMLLSVVIAVTLTLTEFRIFGLSVPDWTRSVLWGLIAFALVAQLVTLLTIQYRRRRQEIAREDVT